ncbi:RHS repeat domain-containing protein [Sediminibacterium soli]|uniref:RHS repeat domain-containing protein n=1 Tax=Sediminibacterium soli TaxID=2698829 RepID=UPI00137B83B0|nr:RHS repeat domain-containing protein [Sediminibacterium soli]NCI46872.1 RHS repeat protein [Sediminibacterium soli]
MRKLFLIACIAMLVSSCGKSFLEPNDDSQGSRKPVLSRILVGTQVSSEFSYDAKWRLVKITRYMSPGSTAIGSETVYRYDDAGRLVKVETAVNISSSSTSPQYVQSYAEMVYDAGNSWKETRNYNLVSGAAQYVSKGVTEYNADGRLSSVTVFAANSTSPANKSVYRYNSQGNVVSDQFFQYNSGLSGPTNENFYEYDQQKNPYLGTWVMPFGANVNNITKITSNNYLSAPGAPANPVVTTTTYKTYNASGYPLQLTENGVDYTYEYK